MSTDKTGNLNEIGGLYQCQYPGYILYYSFGKCYYWEKVNKLSVLFLATELESTIISIKFLVKKY